MGNHMHRRPTPAIRWVLILLAFSLASPLVLAAGKKLEGQQQESNFRIVELSGSAEQIGQSHASQLGDSIRLLQQQYLMRWFRDETSHKKALLAALVFRGQLQPEHRAEIEALAEGAGIAPGDAMLANCFLDLMPMTACSTFTLPADAASDRVARFGRNLDFPALDVADKHSVLLIVRPEGRYAFAAVSWPGLIGVLSGMNEHGLTIANMEVDRGGAMPRAMPYTLLYRTVLERCRNVDEAIALLESTPRQTPNNLMLMDAEGNRAVVEITAEKIGVRRVDGRSALVSTNHQRGDMDNAAPGRCWRYDRLIRECVERFGQIDERAVQKMLGEVGQGKMTLQSMVFEPANRVIYLAVGSDAAHREFKKVELGSYFQK